MAKILVIEDDEMLRRIYTSVLTKENFTVETASTGKEGLTVAATFNPDLIILDMLMPEMDGLTFLREYDLKNKHPDVKVIVFTNVTNNERISEAVDFGAVNYKTKSLFSPKEMIGLIRDTLRGNSLE